MVLFLLKVINSHKNPLSPLPPFPPFLVILKPLFLGGAFRHLPGTDLLLQLSFNLLSYILLICPLSSYSHRAATGRMPGEAISVLFSCPGSSKSGSAGLQCPKLARSVSRPRSVLQSVFHPLLFGFKFVCLVYFPQVAGCDCFFFTFNLAVPHCFCAFYHALLCCA